METKRIILSGGGTGGHIYPAISIANEILFRDKNTEILFVGAKNKMEMNIVPKYGFSILGLWISGINRNNFEMVMLVGFASAGQAVSHQINLGLSNAYTPNEITVRVNVPASKGETMVFEATCSSDIARELAAGTLDSSDFMQKINLQTS